MSVRTFMKFYAMGRPISLEAREKKKALLVENDHHCS